VRTDGDRPLTFLLTKWAGTAKPLRWTTHRQADIAVLRLSPEKELEGYLRRRFIPISSLLAERKAPDRDAPLTVLGFPLGLGVDGDFSPISRETHAASGLLTFKRFDTGTPATFFVTQDPSIGGYSGAPIVDTGGPRRVKEGFLLSSPMVLVGVVHGTLSDATGGKLGAVTPSVFVIEAMKDDAAGRGETFTSPD
jgi:hypothetical protein